MVRMILENKWGDIEATMDEGRTPLNLAALYLVDTKGLLLGSIAALVEGGAQVGATDADGKTPEQLVEVGCDDFKAQKKQALVDNPQVGARNAYGKTPEQLVEEACDSCEEEKRKALEVLQKGSKRVRLRSATSFELGASATMSNELSRTTTTRSAKSSASDGDGGELVLTKSKQR